MTGPEELADQDVSSEASPPAEEPRTHRRYLWIVLAMAVGVLVVDQLVKAWVVAGIKPRLESGEGPIVLLGGFLKFTYLENTGAAFSMGAGYTWIFSIVAVVVAIVIVRTSRRLGSVAWAVALGGLLGGLLGNLTDRLTRPPSPGMGYVVDFIALPNFAVFNIADMFITGSAALMVILALRGIGLDGSRSS